ncbi:MoaD/ThiS family protein [Gryllotalpicola reticulitermitis]|uniref:MoaD/ThiS family protein n=1 Tax=Gryllotalpicola reticulitermitis TaxID=1184153 RepID=A0ABV8Q7J1_9MICO
MAEAQDVAETGRAGRTGHAGEVQDVAAATSVRVAVRYFAAATEATGREGESLELLAPATLGAVQDALLERYGEPMERILRSGSFLVGGVVRRGRDIPVSGTVDVLPPFAGG